MDLRERRDEALHEVIALHRDVFKILSSQLSGVKEHDSANITSNIPTADKPQGEDLGILKESYKRRRKVLIQNTMSMGLKGKLNLLSVNLYIMNRTHPLNEVNKILMNTSYPQNI